MTNQENQFGSRLRRVNAFLTPDVVIGLLLCGCAFAMLEKLEADGLREFTASWFWPVGCIVALAGAAVAFVVASRQRKLGQYAMGAFFIFFLPAMIRFFMIGAQDTPENMKLVLSVGLMVAPWVAATVFCLEGRFQRGRNVEVKPSQGIAHDIA